MEKIAKYKDEEEDIDEKGDDQNIMKEKTLNDEEDTSDLKNIDTSVSSNFLTELKKKSEEILKNSSVELYDEDKANAHQLKPSDATLYYNPKYEELYAPVSGPAHPFKQHFSEENATVILENSGTVVGGLLPGAKITGHVNEYHMNPYLFEEQYNTVMQDYEKRKRGRKRKNKKSETEFVEYEVSEDGSDKNQILEGFTSEALVKEEDDDDVNTKIAKIQKQLEEEEKKRKKQRLEKQASTPTTIFHLEKEKDYLGRSFIHPPSFLKPIDPSNAQCFLPKKWIHTFVGHEKALSSIQFFPKYGHLLLSSSMDMSIKIWDTVDHRRCIRTYLNHAKPVRTAKFQEDGKKFVSCSYDKTVKLWDTETGKVVSTFDNGKTPYCVACAPGNNEILVGYSDKRALQWDLRTGEIVQDYNRHLGAIDTITIYDEGRRFVTTSDDKTLRVWEYGLPVDIKYIADPSMHSMPATALSPNGKWFLGQSLDNQILVYETSNFRQHKKKRFTGHLIAGFACQMDFSNDGRYVISGDAQGNIWFWDWKNSSHKLKTVKAHDGVCIDCAWHPIETSKVATAGWDGTIKYWD